MPSYSMAPDNGRVNRTSKLIVNPWTGPVECCWDDCWELARNIWPIRLHEHPLHVPCDLVDAAGGDLGRHAIMSFCSEGHRDYWLWCSGWRAKVLAAENGGLVYGMAPKGSKIGRFR
jgi:hypothetical protein